MLLHKITKPAARRGGAQTLKKEEEDGKLLHRCEAKMKEWSKHWQCDESVQNLEDKPWTNEEIKKLEEALPRLKECELEKASRLQSQNRSRMRRLPPQSSPGFDTKQEEKSWKMQNKVGNVSNKPGRRRSF